MPTSRKPPLLSGLGSFCFMKPLRVVMSNLASDQQVSLPWGLILTSRCQQVNTRPIGTRSTFNSHPVLHFKVQLKQTSLINTEWSNTVNPLLHDNNCIREGKKVWTARLWYIYYTWQVVFLWENWKHLWEEPNNLEHRHQLNGEKMERSTWRCVQEIFLRLLVYVRVLVHLCVCLVWVSALSTLLWCQGGRQFSLGE